VRLRDYDWPPPQTKRAYHQKDQHQPQQPSHRRPTGPNVRDSG
jgi:hypothetical protein